MTGANGKSPSGHRFARPAPQKGEAQRVEKPPSAREVPRRGGGREPCHSPKYFGQPYSSLPHRLRAEPPRRGGQGVSTPFSTVCGSPARGGFVSGFPHFNKPCLSCYFAGLHGVFHSFNMVFHISTVERCRKPVQNVEKARRGGIFCGSFKVVSHAVHFLGACYNSYKR